MDRSFRLERSMTGLLTPEARLDSLVDDQKQVTVSPP